MLWIRTGAVEHLVVVGVGTWCSAEVVGGRVTGVPQAVGGPPGAELHRQP